MTHRFCSFSRAITHAYTGHHRHIISEPWGFSETRFLNGNWTSFCPRPQIGFGRLSRHAFLIGTDFERLPIPSKFCDLFSSCGSLYCPKNCLRKPGLPQASFSTSTSFYVFAIVVNSLGPGERKNVLLHQSGILYTVQAFMS
ncbi:uncharacterized protein ARMOST_05443 [Armillaria ostoyae]|uniref:Uncharacterized protein n=1 Tax=Armillaria ostoyae TaxID=47428 RepID=A0A284R095_ARMOS|nr:uncharacterized protein ARMOST_05443 [Armillaria ostoyae]